MKQALQAYMTLVVTDLPDSDMENIESISLIAPNHFVHFRGAFDRIHRKDPTFMLGAKPERVSNFSDNTDSTYERFKPRSMEPGYRSKG
ncbi:MAG: hypothetical protein ACK4P3_06310 [Fimbriimonadaceae bacterium]